MTTNTKNPPSEGRLIAVEELPAALGIEKETLSGYRRCQLRQAGSRTKYYRLSEIRAAIAGAAEGGAE